MSFNSVPVFFKFAVPFFALGFFMSLFVFPSYIKKLKKLQWGQEIREEGPQDHLSKKGTPTMGGLVIVCTFILSTAIIYSVNSYLKEMGFGFTTDYFLFAVVIFVNCLMGFVDDFIKVNKHQSLGLRAREKTIVDIVLGLLLAWYMDTHTGLGSNVFIPFYGDVDFGWLLYPFCAFVMVAFVNSVNLTDGLDGLAGGSVVITLAAVSTILYCMGKHDIVSGCLVLVGSIIAFLLFNSFPARIFMGDTGSLALGGAIAAISILTGAEFIVAIIGGVYVIESFSVTLQVTYFKLTKGKRIFRMSPIHHHFTLKGRHEVRVTVYLLIAGLWFAITGLLIYFR